MKNIFILFLLLTFNVAFSQPPQAMNYQASVIKNDGTPLSYHLISIRISILDSISSGPVIYQETFSCTTDKYGLFNLSIGRGTPVIGSFNLIDWAKNDKWQQTEMDTTAGSNFTLMGSSQLVSVPYALYAGNSKGISLDNYVGGFIIGTNYQAQSDGFLIVKRNPNPLSCPGLPSGDIFLDSIPIPVTNFAEVGMAGTTTIPVKKDWYWRVQLSPQCSAVNSTFKIVWISLK